MRWLGLLPLLLLVIGCGALREDLNRAQQSYEEARYQDTLTWLEGLERDVPAMEPPLRARYYYLRGMTTYRLDERSDALHYLALAREEASAGRGLDPDQQKQMARALEELTPKDASFEAREADGSE